MRLRYTLEALDQIAAIHRYIHDRNPEAAARVVSRIRAAAERLESFPRIGHVGVAPGSYEWSVVGLPYVIVYQIAADEGEVVILGVFHGAQQRRSQAPE